MGLIDELKKLTKPYSENEYDDFGDELPEEPSETQIPIDNTPKKSTPAYERRSVHTDYSSPRVSTPQRREKVVNLNSGPSSQLVLVKPERFEKAAEIADHLRAMRSVVLNFEQTDKDTARRLIDFLSGVAYALDGKVQKVAANTFILTPNNVDVMGNLIDELGSGVLENNNLYT